MALIFRREAWQSSPPLRMVCKCQFVPRKNNRADFGILLVYIHGFGGCTEQWSNQTKYFSHFFDQLYFELPGHGENQSSNEKDFSINCILENIETVISLHNYKIKIGIAHSYGCALLSLLAERMEPSFDLLVFCAPCLISPISSFVKFLVLHTPNWAINIGRLVDRIGGHQSRFIQRCLHNRKSELTKVMMHWNKSFDTKHLKFSLAAMKWPSFTGQPILAPTIVIHGANDYICRYNSTFEICKENFTNSEFIAVSNCGHQVMLEYGEFVNALIFDRIRTYFELEIGTVDFGSSEFLPKCPFKNKEKWLETECFGSVFGNFLPMKVILVLINCFRCHYTAVQ